MSATGPAAQIYVALDTNELERACRLAGQLAGAVGGLKLGKEFFTAHGPQGVQKVMEAAGEPRPQLFLDLKFHDIPNTVAGAIRAAAPLRPTILNVHAGGGPAMMQAAAEAAKAAAGLHSIPRPQVIGVTVLTSLDDDDLAAVGQETPAARQVERLAHLAQVSGLDGVVCSPQEIGRLRELLDPRFQLVVPGIRPDWAEAGDQKRVTTPGAALAAGADVLVIGRPITAADDPVAAAQRIVEEISANGTATR